MGFIDSATEERSFYSLCDKARKLSSLAKLKGCRKLYLEKNNVLAHLIQTWPQRVALIDSTGSYWHIFLEGFGAIHVEMNELPEKAKRSLVYLQVDQSAELSQAM